MEGKCETGIGIDYSGPSPVIQKCHKPGKLRSEYLRPFGAILCDDCYTKLREKHRGTT